MAERQISVVRAFSSYAGDGSTEQRYFTAGNAHELEEFLSADEFNYRLENGYITISEATPEPSLGFVRPELEVPEDVGTASTPRARKARGATTTEG